MSERYRSSRGDPSRHVSETLNDHNPCNSSGSVSHSSDHVYPSEPGQLEATNSSQGVVYDIEPNGVTFLNQPREFEPINHGGTLRERDYSVGGEHLYSADRHYSDSVPVFAETSHQNSMTSSLNEDYDGNARLVSESAATVDSALNVYFPQERSNTQDIQHFSSGVGDAVEPGPQSYGYISYYSFPAAHVNDNENFVSGDTYINSTGNIYSTSQPFHIQASESSSVPTYTSSIVSSASAHQLPPSQPSFAHSIPMPLSSSTTSRLSSSSPSFIQSSVASVLSTIATQKAILASQPSSEPSSALSSPAPSSLSTTPINSPILSPKPSSFYNPTNSDYDKAQRPTHSLNQQSEFIRRIHRPSDYSPNQCYDFSNSQTIKVQNDAYDYDKMGFSFYGSKVNQTIRIPDLLQSSGVSDLTC